MQIPTQLNSLASALQAAQTLVDLATKDAEAQSEIRDEQEIQQLQESYGKGAIGRGMASGASKAVKELEKEQKARATRLVRDSIDAALLDLATFYRDVLLAQLGNLSAAINSNMFEQIESQALKLNVHSSTNKLNAIMEARENLARNAAPLATCEALMCQLACN